jgi:hypothetical protein
MRSCDSRGRGPLRKLGPIALLAALPISLAASLAGPAAGTTAPGTVVSVRAIMTDSKIVLVPKKPAGQYVSANGGSATFPRGAIIDFQITNEGSKAYLPAIRIPRALDVLGEKYFTAHKVAAPGGHVEFIVNFAFRGLFKMVELLHKKPEGKAVPISIT